MDRKGSLRSMADAGSAIVFVGLVLAMGVYVSQQTAEELDAGTAQNFSIAFTNATWYSLPYRSASISEVVNYTNTTSQFIADTAGAGAGWDSRVSDQTSQIILYTNESYLAGTYNVSYLARDSEAYTSIANSTSGLGTLSEWLPIIAVVLSAAIVLMTIMVSFGGGGI